MPVASEISSVAVLFGDDDELEFPESRTRAARRDHRAVGGRRFLPQDFVVARDERHAGARDRRAVVEACDENQRVQRAVFDGNAQVGDLYDRRPVSRRLEPF